MVTKLERERAALEAAEKDLAERKKRLAQMEKEEAEKKLARLTKKVGLDKAITLLDLAARAKPQVAIEALEQLAGKPPAKSTTKAS